MSNVKYCPECGNKIVYNYSPPKFCSNCGTQVGASANTIKKDAVAKRRNSRSREVEEGFTDSQYVPDINSLEVEVEFNNNVLSMEGDKKNGISFSSQKFKPRSKSI